MRASYSSDRNGGSVIHIDFKPHEYEAAEEAGNALVRDHDFEWIYEDEERFSLGAPSEETIREMREIWKLVRSA